MARRERRSSARGKIAIANAKLAYQHYLDICAGERWKKLARKARRPQRLLWASTGTKDKAYPDVLYVEELIGRDTVNTIPPATMDAFRDHGHAAANARPKMSRAREKILDRPEKLGISLDRSYR